MVASCAVPYCKSNARSRSKNLSFFQFPSDLTVRQLWLKNIRRANWLPSPNGYDSVCSLHFKESDFREGLKIRKLVTGAAPTVFPDYPKYIQTKIIKESQSIRKPPKVREVVPIKQRKIQIKDDPEEDVNFNLNSCDSSLSVDINSSTVTTRFSTNCVNCNANLRHRNHHEWTNTLTFADWKVNRPPREEARKMNIAVSDAILFIYDITIDDLIKQGLSADYSKQDASHEDVFVCKQCSDLFSELYCVQRKLNHVSDVDAVLRKAIRYKKNTSDVKIEPHNENSSVALYPESENFDFFEDDGDAHEIEIESQYGHEPLSDVIQEIIIESTKSATEEKISYPSNVSNINDIDNCTDNGLQTKQPNIMLPVVRLERMKASQFPTKVFKGNPICLQEEESSREEIVATEIVNESNEKNDDCEIEKICKGKDLHSEPEICTVLKKEASLLKDQKADNVTSPKTDLDSRQNLIDKYKERRFICDCGKRFPTNGLLRRHIRDVHSFRHEFNCETCGLKFRSKRYLRRHQSSHSGRTHVCSVCGRAFTWPNCLKRHYRKLHPTHPIPQLPKPIPKPKNTGTEPGRKNKRLKQLTTTKRSKSANKTAKENCLSTQKPFSCNVCGRTLGTKCNLDDHMRLHTGEKPFKCDESNCEMTFRTLLNLKVHKINVHTNEFPFACKNEECDRKFKLYASMMSHYCSQHTGVDKLFICDLCGKSFKFRADLQRHMRTHDDPSSSVGPKLNCDHCERKFSDKSELTLHVKVKHTKEISFQCEVCGKCLSNSRSLKVHKRIHSGETPYKCDQCNKQWISHAGLWWHQRHSHKS